MNTRNVARHRSVRAVALAGVAGFVDAVGYVVLWQLFTAHMSGNSARLGVDIARGDLASASAPAAAVVVFVLSVTAGLLLAELAARSRSPAAAVLTVEAVLVAVYLGYGQYVVSRHEVELHSGPFWVLAALAVSAMGLQTSALQRVGGQVVRTTFVSGMLAQFSESVVGMVLRERRPAGQRASGGPSRPSFRLLLTGGIWLVYAISAVGGAALELQWQLWCLAIPLAVLMVIAFVEWFFPLPDR